MNLRHDPRTKLICIALVVICTMFFPSLEWEGILIAMICVFGILNGQLKRALVWGTLYLSAYLLWCFVANRGAGVTYASGLAWLGLVFKLFPCCVMAGIVVRSTQVNEFLTAMNKVKISKNIIIPMAVLIRYLPTVKEDWRYIKDAMALRDVTPSLFGFLRNPAATIECLYVPLLITASKTADELSIASVTRGIENPGKRTSIRELKFRLRDYIAIAVFLTMTGLTVHMGVRI